LVNEKKRADAAEEKLRETQEKCRMKIAEMELEFKEITYTMKWRN